MSRISCQPDISHRQSRRQEGSALVVVLLSLLLASLIGMAMAYSGIMEVKISRNYNTSTQAF